MGRVCTPLGPAPTPDPVTRPGSHETAHPIRTAQHNTAQHSTAPNYTAPLYTASHNTAAQRHAAHPLTSSSPPHTSRTSPHRPHTLTSTPSPPCPRHAERTPASCRKSPPRNHRLGPHTTAPHTPQCTPVPTHNPWASCPPSAAGFPVGASPPPFWRFVWRLFRHPCRRRHRRTPLWPALRPRCRRPRRHFRQPWRTCWHP